MRGWSSTPSTKEGFIMNFGKRFAAMAPGFHGFILGTGPDTTEAQAKRQIEVELKKRPWQSRLLAAWIASGREVVVL
jgi:hypothetical protein